MQKQRHPTQGHFLYVATVCESSRHPPKLPLQVKVQDWSLLFHCIGLSGLTAMGQHPLGLIRYLLMEMSGRGEKGEL